MEKLQQKVYFFVILACFVVMLSSCSNASGGGEGGGGDKPSKPSEITYTVEHWQQNILDDDYTKVEADTQTLTGTVNKKTAAQAKSYTGFTAKASEQVTLTEGKNTVIKIYYDRNIITYTFSANGGRFEDGDIEKSYQGKYDDYFDAAPDDPEKLAPVEDPLREDENNYYKHTGWDKEIPVKFGAEDITFNAKWEIQPKASSGISMTFTGGVEITIEKDGDYYQAIPSVPGNYFYEWYLNDSWIADSSDKICLREENLNLGDYLYNYENGYYELSVIAITYDENGNIIQYSSRYPKPIIVQK